jgi:4-hydroxy-tetrahydrodipicolinate synthase
VVDEAKGKLKTVVHGSFDTIEDVIDICDHGAKAGADALLLTYSPTFYPRTADDIRAYTETIVSNTVLAVILFSVHQWNFGHLSPSDIPVELVDYLADLPNVVAIKAEGGPPGNGALFELLRRCGDRLLISDPRESNSPIWVDYFGMQWMGTSNFETFGSVVPTYFSLLHEKRFDEAMELYWKIHPIRQARLADMQSWSGANLIHRPSWKYQAWLNGFNGGPLRMPTMRLQTAACNRLRQAMIQAGTIEGDGMIADLQDFYRGRVSDGQLPVKPS